VITRTFSITIEQSKSLRELSQITEIPQSALIRKALENLLNKKEEIMESNRELFSFEKRNRSRRQDSRR